MGKKIFLDRFLLFSSNNSGCYVCDGTTGDLYSNVYDSIEEVVTVLDCMIHGNMLANYPVRLYQVDWFDGELIKDLELQFEAGCLSGLTKISFKYNKMIYHIKKYRK